MLTNDQVLNVIQERAQSYLLQQPEKSVLRNRHMNNLEPNDDLSFEQINTIVHAFLLRIQTEDLLMYGDKSINVLTALTSAARSFTAEAYSFQATLNQLKAVVVDFINYVGVHCGVDYALYTCDI